jgi:bacteriorhodopsin
MLKETANYSLVVQFITTCIDIWGLTLPSDPKYKILKQLLQLEIIVQIVEFTFYIWLVRNLKNIDNITPYRYLDWMITTPTMLIQLMSFMDYDITVDLNIFLKKYKKEVSQVLVLNWTMMIIGLLGETKKISMKTASLAGFIPFVMYFGIIYQKFVPKNANTNSNKFKRGLFCYYLIVWGLYGVASFLPYIQKNSMYNILDIFAKNFYGLFLVWYIIKIGPKNQNDKRLSSV